MACTGSTASGWHGAPLSTWIRPRQRSSLGTSLSTCPITRSLLILAKSVPLCGGRLAHWPRTPRLHPEPALQAPGLGQVREAPGGGPANRVGQHVPLPLWSCKRSLLRAGPGSIRRGPRPWMRLGHCPVLLVSGLVSPCRCSGGHPRRPARPRRDGTARVAEDRWRQQGTTADRQRCQGADTEFHAELSCRTIALPGPR